MVVLALISNAGLLVAAFLAGLMIRRRSRRQCLAVCAIALALCLFKGALVRWPDLETRLFPWPNYVLFSGWNGPLGMLALGAMAGLVRKRSDWAFLVVGGAVTVAYFGDYLHWVSSASGANVSPHSERYFCYQTTSYTCAPAAAATMLRLSDVMTDEREMADLCLTREGRGTLDLGLYRGLNVKLREAHAGLAVRLVRLTYDDLLRAPKPCILRVRLGLDHIVVVRGTQGDQVEIFDPAAPAYRVCWDRQKLIEWAEWSGYAFVFYSLDGEPLPAGPVALRSGGSTL